eukprot:PhM_4_TR13082/c0_g1_i1/m.56729
MDTTPPSPGGSSPRVLCEKLSCLETWKCCYDDAGLIAWCCRDVGANGSVSIPPYTKDKDNEENNNDTETLTTIIVVTIVTVGLAVGFFFLARSFWRASQKDDAAMKASRHRPVTRIEEDVEMSQLVVVAKPSTSRADRYLSVPAQNKNSNSTPMNSSPADDVWSNASLPNLPEMDVGENSNHNNEQDLSVVGVDIPNQQQQQQEQTTKEKEKSLLQVAAETEAPPSPPKSQTAATRADEDGVCGDDNDHDDDDDDDDAFHIDFSLKKEDKSEEYEKEGEVQQEGQETG